MATADPPPRAAGRAGAEPAGPYLLGTEMLATSFRFCDTLDLRTLVRPYLVQLAGQLNETVHFLRTAWAGILVEIDAVGARPSS